jgi:hypothetical protein
MRFANHLHEEYCSSFRTKRDGVSVDVPVFINPDKKELRELKGDIRFIIDFDNEDVYMWSGWLALHDRMIVALDKQENIKLKNIALGHCESKGGKLRIFDLVYRCKNQARKEATKSSSWLEGYFDNIKYYTEYIREDYCELYKWGEYTAEVYVNPTADDIKQLAPGGPGVRYVYNFRFTADSRTKKVFVWNANRCNHHNMVIYLIERGEIAPVKPQKYPQYDDHLLNGMCEISDSGKLKYSESDDIMYAGPTQAALTMQQDWSWLKKHIIGVGRFLTSMKKLARDQ